jgi:glycosyltransferase 2 family protein
VIFVSATLLGFASHSPGGLGVFDAAMLVGLWQMDREDLLAGMLLFRVLYYIAPFVISVILLTFREVILGARMKRLRQTTVELDAGPPREAAYVRKRGDTGA